MRKIHGYIGYVVDEETYPGVWEPVAVEREFYGELEKNRAKLTQGSTMNGSVSFASNISLIADQYAFEHFYAIRYVTYLGTKWTVTSIEPDHPRLLLTIGEVYHG